MTNTQSTKRALLTSIMAMLLCFTMLLGTTFAWFTDSVSSEGNVIKSGKLTVGFQWADGTQDPSAASWTNVEGALFDYENWRPGYAVAKHLKISNDGTLDLNYQMRIVTDGVVSKLADQIDVYVLSGDEVKALTRADFATMDPIGTLTEVLGTQKNLAKEINGTIKAGEAADLYTLVMKMKENADKEYEGIDLGCTFSLQLLAMQASGEGDFNAPTNIPNEAVPSALVRELDDLNISYLLNFGGESVNAALDTGYKFEPTVSYQDAQNSLYRYWHADFVVSADSSVPANSMALAGYYAAWCELPIANGNWIALTADVDIAANTEIRLVESMGGGSISVNWEEICNYGNDGKGFQCGAIDLTGANAGTTLTVELRLYETTRPWDAESGSANEETGEYITVGSFQYTFPVKNESASNIKVVHNAEELQAALDSAVAGQTNFINFANDITGCVTATQPGATDVDVVINGCGYKFDGTIQVHGNSDFDGAEDDSLVIKNVNFVTSNKKSASGHDAFVWSNDSSNGSFIRYAHNVRVENCTFTAVAGSEAEHAYVGVKVQQAYNISVINCVATNMHTLLQANSCGVDSVAITVDGCRVVNGKNGVSFNNTFNAIITNTEIESVANGGYGIRHQGEVNNYSLSVKNCTVEAFVPVLIRNMTATGYIATFEGENALGATNDFGYEVVVSGNDWDNDSAQPVLPTGSYTLNGAEDFVKNVD